jgi:hypothetical protein
MKVLIVFVVAAIAVSAQNAAVKITNASRPGSADFQVGDRFEVVVMGAPNLPVSVRTMRQGRTDWGPVIAYTDINGRWSTEGQFEKQDFGEWREVWTVGGKVANPVIDLSVKGSCISGVRVMISQSGPNEILSCDTATGTQSFVTPSGGDSFHTPDGRVTPDRMRSEVIVSAITGNGNFQPGKVLSGSVGSIGQIIGVNALTEKEMQNLIAISHATFEGQYRAERAIPELVLLLQRLEKETDQASLKQQLAETITFVQAQ